ncbi:MAG TPA: hypothetical protein VGM58_04190 [Verrucomicrobiae bacterium]|jgi:hypothetical protein
MKTHLPPVQFYRFNEFGKTVVDEYVKAHGNEPISERTYSTIERVAKRFFFDGKGEFLSREQVEEAYSEVSSAREYLDWWIRGKNIFLFSDDLVNAFLKTDVEDIPVSLLKPPFDAFYFKFGQHTQIQTVPNKDRFLDGAYIFARLGGLVIEYTQCSDDGSIGSLGLGFFLDLSNAKTIGEALERGIKTKAEDIHEHTKEAAGFGDGYKFMQDTEAQRRAIFEHGLPIYKEVTKLIANGLAYVLYERDSIKNDWLGAPESLVSKLEKSSTAKEKHRNESKLLSLGFSKVYLCSPVLEKEDGHLPTGRELRPHWRRGHWRRQPCGPNLSLIRLVWVRPTIVRRDKGEPEQGHIYTTN